MMSRVISEQLRKMRTTGGLDRPLIACLPAQSNRFDFWFWGILRFCVGLAQITMSVVCVVFLLFRGITPGTMRLVYISIGMTTASLFLFRVLGKRTRPSQKEPKRSPGNPQPPAHANQPDRLSP
jgi:hypothetical protein